MPKQKTVKRGRPPKKREPVELPAPVKEKPKTKKQDIENDDFFKRPGEVKKAKPAPQKLAAEIRAIKTTLDQKKAALKRIADAEKRAEEIIAEGYEIPGYDLVPALGNTAWLEGVTPAKVYEAFKKFFSKQADLLTVPALKSPTEIKKYFIEDKDAVKKLESFTERPDRGKKLSAV